MYLRATISRPLRSKRAMISPVRPRANASGLTRIRVRSTLKAPFALSQARACERRSVLTAAAPGFALAFAVARDLGRYRRLVGRRRAAAAAARGLRRRLGLHLRLAVWAQL